MHTINTNKYNLRTDLISDDNIDQEYIKSFKNDYYRVEEITIDKSLSKLLNKKEGEYITIFFNDITDKDIYSKVEEVLITKLHQLLDNLKLNSSNKVLVVGLGNIDSTPDALGGKTINNVLVTNHLFDIGQVEEGYRKTMAITPGVTGKTGIETKTTIKSIIDNTKPDFVIIIDALKSSSLNRVGKTIQLSTSGINPGSGVFNDRVELSNKTLNIPVIVIGIPTIVDLVTIITDSFKYIYKHFSYKLDNIDNKSLKLTLNQTKNYEDYPDTLDNKEKKRILGEIGLLDEDKLHQLILEVLEPINYNLMVTVKEIDFLIEKFSSLLASSINKTLHKNFNPTK